MGESGDMEEWLNRKGGVYGAYMPAMIIKTLGGLVEPFLLSSFVAMHHHLAMGFRLRHAEV